MYKLLLIFLVSLFSKVLSTTTCDLLLYYQEEDHSNQCPSSSFESPPHACLTKIAMASEISGDKLERPSPVSVLEPLFMEEETSPARTTSRTGRPAHNIFVAW